MRQRAREFQYPDCYLPPLNQELLFTEASFVMSHDAATGYLSKSSSSSNGLTSISRPYSQTQVGTFYEQLQEGGARALDIRPLLLWNGTVIFQHDAVQIPVSLESTLALDVLTWCRENPKELVLFLPSHFRYQASDLAQFGSSNDDGEDDDNDDDTADSSSGSHGVSDMISAMSTVMDKLGISYFDCTDVYGLTVEEVMDMSAIQTSDDNEAAGHLLVLWNSNTGRSCAKENWVSDRLPWTHLEGYLSASAYNTPTDSTSELGPPASLYYTPLHELQALWQVNAGSVVTGLSHASTLLADNRQSGINAMVVKWLYGQQVSGVLVAVDNVVLHGNAMLSVLRTQCGQEQESSECGTDLPLPRLSKLKGWQQRWTASQWIMELSSMLMFLMVVNLMWKRRKMILTVVARMTSDACSSAHDDVLSSCYHRDLEEEQNSQGMVSVTPVV